MQSTRLRLDPCHRIVSEFLQAFTISRLASAPRAQVDRIRALAIPIIANAWVAAMGQPSPMTGFALVVAAELGARLLRQPALRAAIGASARRTVFALAALTFQLAVDRQGRWTRLSRMPAAMTLKRPALVLQTLCDVKQSQDRPGYQSAGSRPQSTVQHPPRRAS
jgi:hypothetical protein